MDVCVHVISAIIALQIWGDGLYTRDQWKAFATIYLIALLIFLLMNRALYIYNTTIFFYIDRIIKRETLSILVAMLCAGLLFANVSALEVEPSLFFGLCGVTYVVLILEILFFERILDRIITRKHIPRVLYVGSKDS